MPIRGFCPIFGSEVDQVDRRIFYIRVCVWFGQVVRQAALELGVGFGRGFWDHSIIFMVLWRWRLTVRRVTSGLA